MTHPSLWCCAWKLPSFIQNRHPRPHLDEWLPVVDVAVLAVCGQSKHNPRGRMVLEMGWCMEALSQWPRQSMPVGCLMLPLTAKDQRVCVSVCLCVRVWCNDNVFGSWLSRTAVRDQAAGSDCGAGTDCQFPLWDQREPTASGLLAERRKSGKRVNNFLFLTYFYFCKSIRLVISINAPGVLTIKWLNKSLRLILKKRYKLYLGVGHLASTQKTLVIAKLATTQNMLAL